MELCLSFVRRLFIIAVVRGLHVSGVAINVGNEISKYRCCPDSDPVFVNLSCTFTYSTVTSSAFITTKWTNITDPSDRNIVVTVNNDGSLTPGPGYENATIERLSGDRLDGSIELELNSFCMERMIFDCEVTVSGDSPSLATRPVTAINTDSCPDSTSPVTCPDSTSPVTCPDYASPVVCPECTTLFTCPACPTCAAELCNTTTAEPNSTTTEQGSETMTPQPGMPFMAIALALVGLLQAGIAMFMLIKADKVDQSLKTVTWVLLGLGLALCVVAIVLSALYITDTPACELKYAGFDIGGAVCSFVELGCFLGGLIVALLAKKEDFASSSAKRLEMVDGVQPATHSPKRPPSDISRKDVNVDVKQTGGQGRWSPRKNSVEPLEKKATAPMAVHAPAPRKLPPMPQVDVNTEVRALKKKKKKKPAVEGTE